MRGSSDDDLGAVPPVRQPGGEDEQTYLSEFSCPPSRSAWSSPDATAAGNTVQRAQGSLFQLSQTR